MRQISIAIAAAVKARTMSVAPLGHQLVQDRRFGTGVDAERERVRREAPSPDQQDPAGDAGRRVVAEPDRLGDKCAVRLFTAGQLSCFPPPPDGHAADDNQADRQRQRPTVPGQLTRLRPP
jgi:hypothetical protein